MWSDTTTQGSRRRFLHAITAGSAAGLSGFAGCVSEANPSANDTDPDEVRVGIINPLTGGFSELGLEHTQGAELAIEQINESDEYDVDIEYETFDSQADPATGTREAEEAIQDFGVQFMMGGISSSVALAFNDIAQQNGVVYFPPAADIAITGSECNEYVFRPETNTAQIAEAMAQWTLDEFGDQLFYHVADYAYGESVKSEVEKRMDSLSGSYNEVGTTRSDFGSTNYDSFITQISRASEETDALIVGMTGSDLAIFLEQAASRALSDEVPIVTTTASFRPVRAGAGESAYGVYSGVRYVSDLEIEANRAFVDEYRSMYESTPDNFARGGFDAIYTLVEGIREAGSNDPEAVKDALPGIEHETTLGPVAYRECDRQATNPVWMGELVEPESGTIADVDLLRELSGDEAIPACEETGCER